MDPNLFREISEVNWPTDEDWQNLAQTSLKDRPWKDPMRGPMKGHPAWRILYTEADLPEGFQPLPTVSEAPCSWASLTTLSPDASIEQLNTLLLDDLHAGASALVFRAHPQAQNWSPSPNACRRLLEGVELDLVEVICDLPLYRNLPNNSKSKVIPRQAILGHATDWGVQEDAGRMVLDTSLLKERGAPPALELAAALASLTELITQSPVPLQEIRIETAVGTTFLSETARIRALKRLLDILKNELNRPDLVVHVQTQSAFTDLSLKDIWTNLLRMTTSTASALLAGSHLHTLYPHDARVARDNAFSRRLARNISAILREESFLTALMDPLQGAYAMERRTEDHCEGAWELFQTIQKNGGWSRWITSQSAQEMLRRSRMQLLQTEELRRPGSLGTAEFPNAQERADLEHHEAPEALFSPQPRLTQPSSDDVGQPLFVADLYAWLAQELASAWPTHDQDGYGALDLIFYGSLKELSSRISWTENALLSVGLKPRILDGSTTSPETPMTQDSPYVVLVSTDQRYANELSQLMDSLPQGKKVILAGKLQEEGSLATRPHAEIHLKANLFEIFHQILSEVRRGGQS